MSRYEPLAQFLAAKKADSWDASFEEIERRLGAPLPKSAYKYPAWWANQSGPGHSQTRGWRSVGWRTSRLDLERRRVRFERAGDPAKPASANESDDLLEKAGRLTGIADRGRLIEEALRALVQREAARHLIAMGGAMPDFEAPPRRRPELP
jgi:hypothetical protein